MLDFELLIVKPRARIVLRVKYLRVIELLSNDACKVFVDLEFPLIKEVSLAEVLHQIGDSFKSIDGLCDHVRSQLFHLAGVFGEVFRE